LKSYFVTGTDTDVGKTWIIAGLARAFRSMGVNIGVMKPFAAGTLEFHFQSMTQKCIL